jgi:hypothetical protein
MSLGQMIEPKSSEGASPCAKLTPHPRSKKRRLVAAALEMLPRRALGTIWVNVVKCFIGLDLINTIC